MAIVRLDFVPPSDPDIASLHIYESTTPEGGFSEIEEVTAIGTYPSYISYYTTDNASSVSNWFSIAWENTGGAMGELSQPIQGNATTLVQKVATRVLQRAPSLSEAVVVQASEYAVSVGLRVDNPYDPALVDSISYRKLEGLTLLALARSLMVLVVTTTSSSVQEFTAGLISVKTGGETGTKTAIDNIQALLDQAAVDLGMTRSWVAQMMLPEIAQGQVVLSADLSRTIIDVG